MTQRLKAPFLRFIFPAFPLLSLGQVLLVASPTLASPSPWSGQVRIQDGYLDAAYTEESSLIKDTNIASVHSRLNYDSDLDPVEVSIQGDYVGLYGDGLGRDLSDNFNPTPLPRDKLRLFDLSWADNLGSDYYSLARIDRLSVQYTRPSDVLRIGRQAITWGHGAAFQVLDLFTPFSALTLDRDYKVGTDMVYWQHLLSSGSDLEFVAAPMRDPKNSSIGLNDSSFGLKAHIYSDDRELDTDVVLAQQYGNSILGLGLSKNVTWGVVHLDIAGNQTQKGDKYLSGLLGISHTTTVVNRNLFLFGEFYHDGSGLAEEDLSYIGSFKDRLNDQFSNQNRTTDAEHHESHRIDTQLRRVERGQFPIIGRNFLSLGARAEVTANSSATSLLLFNLTDNSAFFQLRGRYDLTDSWAITPGFSTVLGGSNSILKGIQEPLLGNFSYLQTWFVRLGYFF